MRLDSSAVREAVRFTVSLDDVRDSRRLQQRPLVLGGSAALLTAGLVVWWFTRDPASWAVAALAILPLAEWWFAPFDRWFDRQRPVVGSECEIDVDEAGINYHQTGADEAWEATGRIAWSAMTGVRADARVLLILKGRSSLVAIPKRAFPSGDALAQFRSELALHLGGRPQA
jgi:hypothetical protein